MSTIKFKIAAKTDVGRVRTNNEDNFQAACDLTTAPMKWINDLECDLGDKGALLVVADGMGGMNAGEVASDIAIRTIREFFSPERITMDVLDSDVGIEAFMKNSIVEADKRIKDAAKKNPEHRGMGTTIVIGWLLKDSLYVAWCGDSRAYIYNRMNGMRQISKDHSYVQTLVDKGKISHEDAFDYPDSNIITRCLSDSDQKARPDTLEHPITVHNRDIILLCTDGLNGMIRDHEIEQILSENEDDLSLCTDRLIEAACEAAGQDNITVALCQITSGCSEPQKSIRKNRLSNTVSFGKKEKRTINRREIGRIIAIIISLILFVSGGYWLGKRRSFVPKEVKDQDSTILSISKQDYNDTINLFHYYKHQVDSLGDALTSSKERIKELEHELSLKDEEIRKRWVSSGRDSSQSHKGESEESDTKPEKKEASHDKKDNNRKE